jgi:hypothetical protein
VFSERTFQRRFYNIRLMQETSTTSTTSTSNRTATFYRSWREVRLKYEHGSQSSCIFGSVSHRKHLPKTTSKPSKRSWI